MMRSRTKGTYPIVPGQGYAEWRDTHFTEGGKSKVDDASFDEQRLQNMFWFRQQRHQKPVVRMEFARA